MKAGSVLLAFLVATSVIAAPADTTVSEESPPNRVLRLDGLDSLVELPARLLVGLDEVTLEGWIRWRRRGPWDRFFDAGERHRSLTVQLGQSSHDLACSVSSGGIDTYRHLILTNAVRTQAWYHCAVVASRETIEFYVNGRLVDSRTDAGLAAVPNPPKFLLGRSAWRTNTLPGTAQESDADFDEVRVWKVRRSATEIRSTMFQRLKGDETGLIALWNFDDPERPGRDGSGHGNDGLLRGKATSAGGPPPEAGDLWPGTWLDGIVRDPEGHPVAGFPVQVRRAGEVVATATTDTNGVYRLSPIEGPGVVRLWGTAGFLAVSRNLSLDAVPGTASVDLAPVPGATLSGTVLGLDATTPLSAVVVQLLSVDVERDAGPLAPSGGASAPRTAVNGPGPGVAGNVVSSGLTDAVGRYRLGPVPPGRYRLRCQVRGGFADYRGGETFDVAAAASHRDLDFRLAPFKKGVWRYWGATDQRPVNLINALLPVEGGELWMAGSDGICRFDGRTVTAYEPGDGFDDMGFTALMPGPDGHLRVATEQSVYEHDPMAEASGALPFRRLPEPLGRLGVSASAWWRDPDGEVWFGTATQGIWRMEPGREPRQVDPD
ncbi:MAG: hypothetical protein JNL97_04735, partial [Verrucomicrobiales bacterium]|nr:hypothetical protein [Verrucomicrobiales bacterium]